jgi:hypothetical protein
LRGLREVLLARCVKCHGLRVVRNQLFDLRRLCAVVQFRVRFLSCVCRASRQMA